MGEISSFNPPRLDSGSGLHKPQAGFCAAQSPAYVSVNIYWFAKVTERPMHIPRTEHVRFQKA
ncbi:hypothetical protein MES4922_370003 [Mesorhizobium ventifaucium]|uniref:Uncharacterized protein n=1 Tax=Mesorhizobium ventifaucium TaxID=666020 RepID=A0ABM9E6J9_9HYPH|nr:hypothetical protein MES4922_370003 [Mesorhizobium ventifaucium]